MSIISCVPEISIDIVTKLHCATCTKGRSWERAAGADVFVMIIEVVDRVKTR